MGIRDVLLVSNIVQVNIVAVLLMLITMLKLSSDIRLTKTVGLCDSQCFLVRLVIGSRNHLLIEVGHLVSLTIGKRVFAQYDPLAENLVVPRAAIPVVRLSVQVIETRSGVARVRVTIGTNAFRIIIGATGTIASQFSTLISRLVRRELTRVGVQSVTMPLSVEVIASVACSILASVATLLTIAAPVTIAAAVVASVTVSLLLLVVVVVAAVAATPVVAISTVALAAIVVVSAIVAVGVAILSVGAALAAILAVTTAIIIVTVTVAAVAVAAVAVAGRKSVGIAAIATIAATIVTILALLAVPVLAASVGIRALVASIAIIR